MKKILCLLTGILMLGACASVSVRPCGENLARPYFFEQGEKLAAFRMILSMGEQEIEGILQIKKTAEETYEVTMFSTAGAYRFLQATLTREGANYNFLVPGADHSAVRVKVERFLGLLLFPSQTMGSCKTKSQRVRVNYKHAPMTYTYNIGKIYPDELTGPKSFGHVHLRFEDYQPYEDGQLPHKLYYEDGRIRADLVLLRIKK